MDVSALRWAVVAASVAVGGVVATVGAVALLFREEGRVAQHHVGHRLGDRGPDADRLYYPGVKVLAQARPVRLAIAGDSVADSLGASGPATTLGAQLAHGLAAHAQRAVELRTIAVVGAKTAELTTQIQSLPRGAGDDLTVIIVGGNDVTNRVPLADSIRHLQEAVTLLQGRGSTVVVGTCPDFDTLPSLPQPLREFGGQLSRRLASAQFKAMSDAGARPVLLGRAVRQVFLADPQEMFSLDGFHPSDLGYRSAAAALLPAVFEAYDERLQRFDEGFQAYDGG